MRIHKLCSCFSLHTMMWEKEKRVARNWAHRMSKVDISFVLSCLLFDTHTQLHRIFILWHNDIFYFSFWEWKIKNMLSHFKRFNILLNAISVLKFFFLFIFYSSKSFGERTVPFCFLLSFRFIFLSLSNDSLKFSYEFLWYKCVHTCVVFCSFLYFLVFCFQFHIWKCNFFVCTRPHNFTVTN